MGSLTSIILLTKDGLPYTKECIASIFAHTKEQIELIAVDNGSTDGTVEYLRSLPKTKVIANKRNRGFPVGCNQGLSMASGESIVLLNNDTVVTKDWLKRLLACLYQKASTGIAGPRSNYTVPHQIVAPVPYKTMEEMHVFAAEWSERHHEDSYEADYLSGLCMAFDQTLLNEIGGFDERFYPGYYEDTDLCLRALILDKRLMVANDVFIHHYGSSSFKDHRERHKKIIKQSEAKFFQKWKINDLSLIKEAAELEKPFLKEKHYVPYD
ncbi:glycosyltransferase family 2 protein [Metabacillus sp. 84]|uniref:glycosyltransferase family 2 protein n=1 Tax=unclassified Metabacillus TaxID=2675274 RepID=UPI003CEFCAAF